MQKGKVKVNRGHPSNQDTLKEWPDQRVTGWEWLICLCVCMHAKQTHVQTLNAELHGQFNLLLL